MGQISYANCLLLFRCVYKNVRTAIVFWKCVDVLARCYTATRVLVFRSCAFIFFVLVGFFAQIEGANAPAVLEDGTVGPYRNTVHQSPSDVGQYVRRKVKLVMEFDVVCTVHHPARCTRVSQ